MENHKQPASTALPDDKQSNKQVANSGTDATVATYSTVDDSCILFGRGKACNNHTGNQRMRLIIDGYRDEYQSARRGDKKMVVHAAYKEVVEAGMKFLKQEDGIDGWIKADADEAIKKVGHSIRCHRSRYKHDAGTEDRPTVARVVSAASDSNAPVYGQMAQTDLGESVREQLASPLGLLRMSSAARAGLLSSGTVGNQEILGSTLSMAPNPLLSLGSSIPAQMDHEILLSMASNPLLSIGGISTQMDQSVLRSTLSVASNQLLSLGSIPMQTDLPSLYAGTSASMGLAGLPLGLHGLSSVDLHVMTERERELRRHVMLRHHILRNTEQR